MRVIIKLFSTLGVGYIPIGPGTFGTLVGVLLFRFVYSLPTVQYLIFVLAFIFFASWISGLAQWVFGEKDSGKIVIDEVAGFLVAMIGSTWDPITVVLGFVLFRIFDIWKPFPIRKIDRHLTSGLGVVLDDVLAGVYTLVVLSVINYFL